MQKRQTLSLNEHVVEPAQKVATDLVLFNDVGDIVGWMLYSSAHNKWFSLPLAVIEAECPGALETWQGKVFDEVIPEGTYSAYGDFPEKRGH